MPPNWDDLSASPPAPEGNSPPDWDSLSASPPDWDSLSASPPSQTQTSGPGAMAARFAVGAVPAAAGGVGTAVGGALGALGGPAAPVTIPAGAIAGGMFTAWLAAQAQKKALDATGLSEGIDRYLQAAQQQHPIWSGAGAVGDAAISFASNPAATITQKLAGAGANMAIAGATDQAQEGKINPWDVGEAGVSGFLFPGSRNWVKRAASPITGPLERAALKRVSAANPPAPEPPQASPDDIEVGNPAEDAQVQAASAPPKTSLGVAEEQPPVTAQGVGHQGTVANGPEKQYAKGAAPGAQTTTTQGQVDPTIAHALTGDEGIPPFLQRNADGGLANPGPMNGAPRPEQPPPQPPMSTGLAQAPPEQPQQSAPGGTAPPVGARIPSTMDPVEASQVQRQAVAAVQQRMAAQQHGTAFQADKPIEQMTPEEVHAFAMTRPVIRTPMPSIANSVKNGAVVIDPRIPEEYTKPLALHETYEEWLEAQGKSYDEAHILATHAERALVEQMGMNWDDYSAHISHLGKEIEAQKIPYDQMPANLHVDPYKAIGHHTEKAKLLAQSKLQGPTAEQPAEVTAPAVQPHQPGPGFERGEPRPHTPNQLKQINRYRAERGEPPVDAHGNEVTAPVTTDLEGLKQKFPRVFERLNQSDEANRFVQKFAAMTPEQQSDVSAQLERGSRGAEGRRPTIEGTGVQARTAKEATARGASLKALRDAVAAGAPDKAGVIPVSTPDRSAFLTRLKKIVDAADADPNVQAQGTWIKGMRSKPPEVQIYRAAKALLAAKNPTPKKITDFINLETQLSGAGAKEAATETQATKRINADIELSRRPIAEDVAASNTQNADRFTPEAMKIVPGKDNKYAEGVNQAKQFLDALTEPEYRILEEGDFNPRLEFNEPKNGPDLIKEMMRILGPERSQDILNRIHGETFDTGAEDMPGTPRSIRNATDVKALEAPRAEAEEDELTKLINEQKADQQDTEARTMDAPAEGTTSGLMSRAKEFLGDEAGALNIMPFLKLRQKPPAAVQQTVEQLRHEFNVNDGTIHNTEARLRGTMASALPRIDKQGAIDLYRKSQTRAPLNAPEQAYYDSYVKPLQQWYDRLYNMARKRNINLPEPYNGGKTAFIPRLLLPEEKAMNDLPWKHTLGDYNPSTQERDFFALDDGSQRLTFKMTPDGNLNIIRGGNSVVVKNLPAGFAGEPGQSLPLKIKGKTTTFKVDHATTPEIMKDVPGLQYVEHLVITYANAIYNTQKALIRDNLLQRMKSNALIDKFSTTDPGVRRVNGYKPTSLEDMMRDDKGKTRYYHPALAWLMDDFARPGIGGDTFDTLGRYANYLARPLYALSPAFHPLNVAANWAVGTPALVARAQSLGQVGKWAKGFLGNLHSSYKEVFSQQGNDLNEIRAGGGRLMYDSQLFNQGLIEDAINQFGMKLAKRPGPWNTAAKALGIPDVAAELPRRVMQGSNRVTWMANDMLTLSLYKTAKSMGMEPAAAAKAVSHYIGGYRATENQTFLTSRIMQRIANEPALSWFGPYHQDLWHTIAHITKGVVDPVDNAHRKEAFAAAAALAGLTYGVFPYFIDPMVKMLTGNQDAESGRRGLSALADIPRLMHEGDPRAIPDLMQNILTPSIPAKAFSEGIRNKDWKGKDILTAGAPMSMQAGEAADWAARSLVPPYGNVASLAKQQGITVGDLLKKMAESSVGIKDPSDKAVAYKLKQDKTNAAEIKRRTKAPEGFIERFTNGQ